MTEPPPLDAGNRWAAVTADDRGGILYIVAFLTFTYSSLTILTRGFIKWHVLGLDDAAAIVAQFASIVQFALLLTSLSAGLAKNFVLLSPEEYLAMASSQLGNQVALYISLGISKMATNFLVQRLFTRDMRKEWVVCNIVTAVIAIWTIAAAMLVSTGCTPTSIAPQQPAQMCRAIDIRYKLVVVTDALIDLVLVLIPGYLTWRLHMSVKLKLQVIAVFALRLPLIVLAACSLKAWLGSLSAVNPGVDRTPAIVFQQVELCVSLLAATLPCLKSFIRSFDTGSGVKANIGSSNENGSSGRNGGSGQNHGQSYRMSPVKSTKTDSTNRSSFKGDNGDMRVSSRPFSTGWSTAKVTRAASLRDALETLALHDADRSSQASSKELFIHRETHWEVFNEEARASDMQARLSGFRFQAPVLDMSYSTTNTALASPQKSTPASSPPITNMDEDIRLEGVSEAMHQEEERMRTQREKADAKREAQLEKERQDDLKSGKEMLDKKFQQLEFLMNKSKLYATVMLAQMQRQEDDEKAQDEKTQGQASKREKNADKAAAESQRRATRGSAANGTAAPHSTEDKSAPKKKGRGRPTREESNISSYFKKEDVEKKTDSNNVADALKEAVDEDNVKTGDMGMQNLRSARQPKLVVGGTMRSYQLEGLEWMLSLYENGINGILADEMGLGKTIQTISMLAHLWENQSYGPFLIAAPLSTTSNWVAEFEKWTPSIPVMLYHGDKKERERLRRTRLRNPGTDQFPIMVTSYEICMNDRKYLTSFGWQFIIIDEGHRIKNLDCRLIRELQQFQSANRLLITGTPLQNNLTELWSLLHFLLPTVFDKLSTFESWFDFSGLKDKDSYAQLLSEERQQYLVKSLHAVLKPFLLRRVKTDVESLMPKKREYVLYAPLTAMQRELYQAILDGTSRSYLEERAVERLSIGLSSRAATPLSVRSHTSGKRKALGGISTPNKSAKTSRAGTPASVASTKSRGKPKRNYEEVSDSEYFASLDKDQPSSSEEQDEEELDSEAEDEKIRAATFEIAKRQLMQKKLGNPIMQLRLCCNSPYNFFNPFLKVDTDGAETFATESEPDETLISTSGKMLLLDSLLPPLINGGHKVLIFSQFTTTLDLLGQYLHLRSWPHARIDGSVAQADRQAQILAFNKTDNKTATNVFLLSTRAGGQGINLAAADTVILFDSDWNPQQDVQAMDRAHRIGQTRNVIVYRFATRNTVEQKLLENAEAKRRLEKLVIRKGGVRNHGGAKARRPDKEQQQEMEDLQKLLRRSDGEKFDIEGPATQAAGKLLGHKELAILLDRSDDAYERAERGLDVGGGEASMFHAVGKREQGALMDGLSARQK
ncbi:putative ATPase [Pleosporales sp. CAS-2024a]